MSYPDLTQSPPRSPRATLGGYALLPRMLDKGRATLAGKNGEFHYNCPLDQHIVNFLGIDADELLSELKAGKGDTEILEWIQVHQKNKHTPWEIQTWTEYQTHRGPDSDPETVEFFYGSVKKLAPKREDIRTWADYLDLDDYVTFGGKA
jgi:hypothetical protein